MNFSSKPAFLLRVLAASVVMTSAVRADDEEVVLGILRPISEANLKGDLTAGFNIVYEPLLEEMGGKKTLVAAVEQMQKKMTAGGYRMLKHELIKPVRFVKGEKNRYAIVRTLAEMETPQGRIQARSFQLGVEVEPGKWQFVDGSRAEAAIKKYFPDFPADEKLPEVKQEMAPAAK